MSAATGRVQRAAYRVWLAVGALALVWIAWRVLARPLAVVIPPLLLTTVIVYLLAPIVAALERRGVPRWLGTLLAYLGGLLSVAAIVALLTPMLTEQLRTFVDSLPQLLAKLGEDLDRRLAPLGIDVPVGETIDTTALQANLERALEGGGVAAVAGVLGGLSGLALGLLQVVIVFTLGPVMAFYVLIDLRRLGRWARSLIPPQHRAEAIEVGSKLHHVVGGFIRGQLLVALFVGVATSIGLAVVGLPFWLLIGVTAGLTNMIPLLGPFVAGALGVTIALVSDGLGLAALVLLVMVVVQQLDNQLVSPLVMGRNVQVHPVVVLLALVIAGTVYGVIGLLIAVPSVAAGNVLVSHFWETRVSWARMPDTPTSPRVQRAQPSQTPSPQASMPSSSPTASPALSSSSSASPAPSSSSPSASPPAPSPSSASPRVPAEQRGR